jgi:hypothetical protein
MDSRSVSTIGLGCRIEIDLIGEGGDIEPMSFVLVADQAADLSQGRLGAGTPLGKALRGKRVGALVPYVMGDIRAVRVRAVEPGQDPAPEDAAARRQAILDEALRKAEHTNAEMFASSYSGKWGDYDTAAMTDVPSEEDAPRGKDDPPGNP